MAPETAAQASAARRREVSFDASAADYKLVDKIVARVAKLLKERGEKLDRQSTRMDLIATHANGCPMDFAKLLAADDFNLCHDVFGIARHLDRKTGELTNFFRPRCAAKDRA